MVFPSDSKKGDLFWMENEPVRITAWNYTYGLDRDRYFDLEFINYTNDFIAYSTMILIPISFNFYQTEIRKMSTLEAELF